MIHYTDYNLSILLLFMIPGSLPTEIGNLINVYHFYINSNRFNGKILINITFIIFIIF